MNAFPNEEKIVEVPQVEIREVLRRVPKTMVQYVAPGQSPDLSSYW